MTEWACKSPLFLCFAALLAFSPKADAGILFDFLYEFDSGDLLEGSLLGDIDDTDEDLVRNVTDVSATYNGVNLHITFSSALSGIGSQRPIISFSGNWMSIIGSSGGFPPATSFLLCAPPSCGTQNAAVRLGTSTVAADAIFEPERWILSEDDGDDETPLPEPGTWALVALGSALAASALRRAR